MGTAANRARTLAARSVREFFADGCPQRAAAVSYYALLSLFPLVILVAGALGRVVDSTSARDAVVDFVLARLPLRAHAGRAALRSLLDGVAGHATGLGVLGALGLVFAASGVMGAVRHGLNAAWDAEDPRPPLRGKLVDLGLVLGFGLVVGASLGLSLLVRLTSSVGASGVVAWGARIQPLLVSATVFAVLFRLVPAPHTGLRDTWPGVVVAALGFEAAKLGFSFYLGHFAHYGAVYASLGSIAAFLVFVWIAANVLLTGAEVASEWSRLRRQPPPAPKRDPAPLRRRLVRAMRGLVVR